MSSRFVSSITSLNLHRWINHSSVACNERMNKCLSLQWEDYNINSSKMENTAKILNHADKIPKSIKQNDTKMLTI